MRTICVLILQVLLGFVGDEENCLFLNNQLDALIIQIYSVIKLYIFRASSLPIIRVFFTVNSALVSFIQVSDDRLQAESGGNCSSILTLLGSCHQKPACKLPVPNVK
jgi:hypothetical protein